MANYSTPGVYIEEISLFPPSVVRVATAIPAFIGYTEFATYKGQDLTNVPTKIKSLVEFEQKFGGEAVHPDSREITVVIDPATGVVSDVELTTTFYTYHALRHFYSNGGGDCYIVSVGDYTTSLGAAVTPAEAAFTAGIDALKLTDEPTLLLFPDAYGLAAVNLGNVQKAALAHCNNLQDRFAILDVKDSGNETADATSFRNEIGNQYLKYGAAYYPKLETTLTPNGTIGLDSFSLEDSTGNPVSIEDLATGTDDALLDAYVAAQNDLDAVPTEVELTAAETAYDAIAEAAAASAAPVFVAELTAKITAIKNLIDDVYALGDTVENEDLIAFATPLLAPGGGLNNAAQLLLTLDAGFAAIPTAPGEIGVITVNDYDGSAYAGAPDYNLAVPPGIPVEFDTPANEEEAVTAVRGALDTLFTAVQNIATSILTELESIIDTAEADIFTTSATMASIKQAIQDTGYTMPPSGAIAGVYASVDRNRGVWKAPANVSLSSVTKVRKMADSDLDDLNLPTNGKAINAIRLFRGQGILVYGARTLDGNSNEWRYVPVRRTFIMIEESVKKATEPFVFEPNDANTWQKVRAMIENFLITLWRDGALAGAVPKDAFYVKCGINDTMTADDILNGYLIVEIGLAVVRPAEFIILKFSHKLQES